MDITELAYSTRTDLRFAIVVDNDELSQRNLGITLCAPRETEGGTTLCSSQAHVIDVESEALRVNYNLQIKNWMLHSAFSAKISPVDMRHS